MRIVTLMENTACREALRAEHGLSLYVEAGGKRILFDAGQSSAFAENAEKLEVDLAAVDAAVLSHGHYDHGGGLETFLKINHRAPVYVSREAFRPHYNAAGKYIGLPDSLAESGRLILTEGTVTLGEGITLCPGGEPVVPVEPFGLTAEQEGQRLPEDFRHEQYLRIREKGKTVLFSGCSHRGVLNILHWFSPDVLIGGFHFMKLDSQGPELARAVEELLKFPTTYYTCHCTGEAQFAAMKTRMGERLQYLRAGSRLELE